MLTASAHFQLLAPKVPHMVAQLPATFHSNPESDGLQKNISAAPPGKFPPGERPAGMQSG